MDKKKLIISLAIAIIFALFIGYGIEVFDSSPDSRDFCKENLYEINDEDECLKADGEWNSEMAPRPVVKEEVVMEEISKENMVGGICSPGRECYDAFDAARNRHDQIVFVAGVIIGLMAVITGILLKRDAISTGLLGGGVLVILYGTLRYWQHANDVLKFLLLGATFGVLVWIAYKKLDGKN